MDARADALVANLTDDELSWLLLDNVGKGIERIGWPALHGVARDGVATSFPQIIGVASSLNRSLWTAVGDATSTEGRGKNNELTGQLYQGLTFWAPNVNIFRDPRWGRGQETPGEDPTVNSEYAAAFVQGMQGTHPKYLKVSACLKHFAAYSEETSRDSFAANVTAQDMEPPPRHSLTPGRSRAFSSLRTLQDTYLPAFQSGVEKGNASGIMCSYNAETFGYGIDGKGSQGGAIPSCANKGLLNDLARGTWGFDGYVTSDCAGVQDVEQQHHYTSGPDDTARAVLTAGMDTNCGGFMMPSVTLPLLRDTSTGGRALVTDAAKHLFKVQLRLGFADPPSLVPWAQYGQEKVNTAAHQALALEAAEQSFVLLKNTRGTLPLKPSKSLKVLVSGRSAKATTNMQGNYFGTAPFLVSPVDGLAKHAQVVYDDGSDASSAAAKVAGVDAVVLVVGLNSEGQQPSDEAEGLDRSTLKLPSSWGGDQDALIAAVSAAATQAPTPTPVVLCIMSGGPVDVSAAINSTGVGGIMWVGYPGQSGGDAMARAIFGLSNRFGKLTQTWYPEAFLEQASLFQFGMRPDAATGYPGRSHRFYEGPALFKFGDGLSYTTFERRASLSRGTLAARHVLAHVGPSKRLSEMATGSAAVLARAMVVVTNTGGREGDDVVLLFAAPPGAGTNGRPRQVLVGFERVRLASGGAATVTLPVHPRHLTLVRSDGSAHVPVGDWVFWANDGRESASLLSVQK
eukprot:g5234.t1